jgi:putative glutamine amidotransferase
MTGPIIGISCYLEPASWGAWRDVPATLIPQAYIAKVEQAGGVPLLIPPRVDADPEWAWAVLGRLDGLILAGGVDIESGRYGADPHPSVQAARPDRDAAELALATAAVAADLPLLGICRGMQVMAVASGGLLEQHVPDRVGHLRHSPALGVYGQHEVRISDGSRLAGILGAAVTVPSYHHQAVTSHPGYLAVGWDPDDQTLEAFEDPAGRFRLAVQWHPEVGEDPRLFDALVAASRAPRPQS